MKISNILFCSAQIKDQFLCCPYYLKSWNLIFWNSWMARLEEKHKRNVYKICGQLERERGPELTRLHGAQKRDSCITSLMNVQFHAKMSGFVYHHYIVEEIHSETSQYTLSSKNIHLDKFLPFNTSKSFFCLSFPLTKTRKICENSRMFPGKQFVLEMSWIIIRFLVPLGQNYFIWNVCWKLFSFLCLLKINQKDIFNIFEGRCF